MYNPVVWMAKMEPPANPVKAHTVFLSHSHADSDLAEHLAELVKRALRCEVFCSSIATQGLAAGEKLDNIRTHIEASLVMVGLITRNSLKSQSSLSEMSIGNYQGKLIPVLARSSYAGLLHWPFQATAAVSLDSSSEVNRLVRDVAKFVGLTPAEPGTWRDEATKVEQAAKSKPREFRREVWRRVAGGAVAAALLVGIALGWAIPKRPASPPPRIVVLGADFVPLDGVNVRVALTETVPTKWLSERLTSVRRPFMREEVEMANRDARQTLLEVLDKANQTDRHPAFGLLDSDQMKRAKELVNQWNLQNGNATSIQMRGSSEKPTKRCASARGLDREWCTFIDKVFASFDPAEGEKKRRQLDSTTFALLETEQSNQLLSVVEKEQLKLAGKDWRVEVVGLGPGRGSDAAFFPGKVVLREERGNK